MVPGSETPGPRSSARAVLGLLLLPAVLAAGCAGDAGKEPVIGASIPPVASLTAFVAGDRLPVLSLMPPGRSPHDFEPTPAQMGRLGDAVLFVRTGTSVDDWMRRVGEGVGGADAAHLTLLSAAPDENPDPHLWLDLDTVEAFIPRLAETLAGIDPGGADGYRARATAFLDSLRAFDQNARERLAPAREVPFALLHSAFLDFTRRYDLRCVAVLERHPEGEVSPRHLGEVLESLRESGARVVFAEPQLSGKLAEAMAGDISGRVSELDPLGGSGVPGRETYMDLLRWNLDRLVEQLDEDRH